MHGIQYETAAVPTHVTVIAVHSMQYKVVAAVAIYKGEVVTVPTCTIVLAGTKQFISDAMIIVIHNICDWIWE